MSQRIVYPTKESISMAAKSNNCEFYFNEFSKCFDNLYDKKHLPLDICNIYSDAFNQCYFVKSQNNFPIGNGLIPKKM